MLLIASTCISKKTNHVHPQAVIKGRQKSLHCEVLKCWECHYSSWLKNAISGSREVCICWLNHLLIHFLEYKRSIIYTLWTLSKHWLWRDINAFTQKLAQLIFCRMLNRRSQVQNLIRKDSCAHVQIQLSEKVLMLKCNYESQTKGLKCGVDPLNSHLFLIYQKSQFHG